MWPRKSSSSSNISLPTTSLCVSDSSVGGQPCYWSAFFSLSSFFSFFSAPSISHCQHTHISFHFSLISLSLISLSIFFFFFLAKENRRIAFGDYEWRPFFNSFASVLFKEGTKWKCHFLFEKSLTPTPSRIPLDFVSRERGREPSALSFWSSCLCVCVRHVIRLVSSPKESLLLYNSGTTTTTTREERAKSIKSILILPVFSSLHLSLSVLLLLFRLLLLRPVSLPSFWHPASTTPKMLLIAKAFDILLRTHTCVNGFDFPLYRHNWSLDKMTTNISCKGKFWLFFSFSSISSQRMDFDEEKEFRFSSTNRQ